ncbi:MAG: isoaspartyl peptidase/L-asparaginase, partial [Flavobacteriales bacterium]
MINRRSFIKIGGAAAALSSISALGCEEEQKPASQIKPVVISTWNHGLAANARAWEILSNGGKAIDAVEAGVRVTEEDPAVSSVGIGGSPDRSGVVTLDACIMNEKGDCGSVACLKDIVHPISVARKVMEETPHVLLAGKGAEQF